MQKKTKNIPKKHNEKSNTPNPAKSEYQVTKIRPTRGERGDPGWNPPRKKTSILQKPSCWKGNLQKGNLLKGKGAMQEGYTQTVTECQHAPRRAAPGPGANFMWNLAHFGLPFGSRWLTFGSRWLTFGSLWLPLGPFWLTFGVPWLTFGALSFTFAHPGIHFLTFAVSCRHFSYGNFSLVHQPTNGAKIDASNFSDLARLGSDLGPLGCSLALTWSGSDPSLAPT